MDDWTGYGEEDAGDVTYEYPDDGDKWQWQQSQQWQGQQPPQAEQGQQRRPGLSNALKAGVALVVAIAYFLFPADLIPDVAIGLGQVDDIAVCALGVVTILSQLRPRK